MKTDKKYFSIYVTKPLETAEFAKKLKEIPGVLESRVVQETTGSAASFSKAPEYTGRYTFDTLIDANAGVENAVMKLVIEFLDMSELGHIELRPYNKNEIISPQGAE